MMVCAICRGNKRWPSCAVASVMTLLTAKVLAHPHTVELTPVVVTATGHEQSAQQSLSSISVISGKSLRTQPVLDVADAVRLEPGVQITHAGLGRRGISIRGMQPDHTLYLVNGRRLSPSSSIAHSDFELDWVPAEAIERVELLRGPISSLYGSEAMGGVVNVITRDATDSWQGTFSASTLLHGHRAGNLYKTGIYAGGPIVQDKVGLQVWGELKRRNPMLDSLVAGSNVWEKIQNRQGGLLLHLKPTAQQSIDLSSMFGYETRHDQRGTAHSSYHTQDTTRRYQHALSYKHHGDMGETRVRLYQVGLKRNNQRTDGNHAEPVRFKDSVVDASYRFDHLEKHAFTAGAEYRKEQLREASVNKKGRAFADHWALLLQDEMQIGDTTEVVVGARADHHHKFGWEWSPRIYARHQLTNAWSIKGGVGTGFKAPNLKQLSPEFESLKAMGGRGVVRGNPELKPEKNLSYELGVQYQSEQVNAGVTAFHNNVRQLIVTQRQATCDVRGRVCLNYENVERARLQGVELFSGWQINTQWNLHVNYTYLRAKNRVMHRDLDDRARHVVSSTLRWQPTEKWQTRWVWEHVGAMPYTKGTQSNRQPSYDLWSMYVDYRLNRHVQLLAGIENMTNKKLANDGTDRYSNSIQAGRGAFIGLRASF